MASLKSSNDLTPARLQRYETRRTLPQVSAGAFTFGERRECKHVKAGAGHTPASLAFTFAAPLAPSRRVTGSGHRSTSWSGAAILDFVNELPKNPSESFKRANPHLYSVGGLAAAERKRGAKPALDKKPRQRKTRKGSVVIRCSIIACRRRLLDDDNAAAGAKPLRDAIAKMFGLDDDDARIRFEYGQMQTNGTEGTIVKLERL